MSAKSEVVKILLRLHFVVDLLFCAIKWLMIVISFGNIDFFLTFVLIGYSLVTDDANRSQESVIGTVGATPTLCCGVPRDQLRLLSTAASPQPLQSPPQWHYVLFQLPLRSGEGATRPPMPRSATYHDAWNRWHVRLPCSPESVYPQEGSRLVPRWNLIERALRTLIEDPARRITSYDLEEAIRSYNVHLNEKWDFEGLHTFLNEVSAALNNHLFVSVLFHDISILGRAP